MDITEKQKIDTDLINNNYWTWDPYEVHIQTRILATYRDFFYDTGRFPGRNTLIHVPMADMPSFINSNDWISPRSLYETYLGRDMQGLTSVQFLAAFNRFLGGDREISRNATSEFFHNLSWQALTNDNDSVKINFEAITELVKSINSLLQQRIYKSKKRAIVTNYNIQKKLLEKEAVQLKTDNEIVEQKVVTNILNNDKTDYTPRYNFPIVKTDEEAERDRVNENKNYIATELVKNERDIQIIDDITKKDQKDLICSIADPADGIITNENITPPDYTRNDNNEPVQPQLDTGVLTVMEEMVKIMSEQAAVMDSIVPPTPALEDIPQNNPIQVITQPDLQDILTKDEPDLTDIVKLKDEIADVISTDDVQNMPPFKGETSRERPDIVSLEDVINLLPNNIIPNPSDIGLILPVPTGTKEVDEKNYDDYLDTLQQIRPDLFISEDDESDNDNVQPTVRSITQPKTETDFVPVGQIKTEPDYFIPTGQIKTEPDYVPTEPDYIPIVDGDGNIFIKDEPVSDIEVSDIEIIDSDAEPVRSDIEVDSDAETIFYLPNQNLRNQIYRKRAKKKALKILAKKRAKNIQNIKNKKKTHVLRPTDVPMTSTDPNDIIGDPNVTTILPPVIKTEVDGDIDFNIVESTPEEVTYVKYIPPPPEVPVPPPINPRERLRQKTILTDQSSDIDIGDDSDLETIPYTSDIGDIPDVEIDSDAETISYLPNLNLRNQIYRRRAKKRALKTLAKKRKEKIQRTKKIQEANKKKTHILVPTDVKIESTDPNEILGNPNVTTTLPPQVKTEIKTEDDYINIDPSEVELVWDNYATDLVPLELDTDKIVMPEDGDVILTEPDNMHVQEGQLVPLSDDTLMLPPEENMTGAVSTRNIVVKRKLPDVSVGEIKKTKGETEISVHLQYLIK